MMLLDRAMTQFIKSGKLRITDADGKTRDYVGGAGPQVSIRLTDRRLHKALGLQSRILDR